MKTEIAGKNEQFCLRKYLEFLYMARKYPDRVVSPMLSADYMWHAHLQNGEAYRTDMNQFMGIFLNYRDDFRKKFFFDNKKIL